MSLKDLSDGDFQYLKRKAQAMLKCHEDEFVKRIQPDLMRAMYRGRNTKDYQDSYANRDSYQNDQEHIMALTRMFQSTNTVLPNLYYQNPSPIINPGRDADEDQSALMSALIKHYMKMNNAKVQNQEAVMNSWFFGLGWKKEGYRTVILPRTNEPEDQIKPSTFGSRFMGGIQTMLGMKEQKPDNTQSKDMPDFVDYETLFNDSESPMNIALDDKTDLLNCKAILHSLPRTLHDLQISGDYDEDILTSLYEEKKVTNGTRLDAREINLTLRELHIWQRNGIWILTYCDEYSKPLKYEPSSSAWKGFLFSPLALTFEPGVRYPVSHLKVGSQVQMKLDNLASMYVEIVARSRHILGVDVSALAPGQEVALERNLLQGILKFNRPITEGTLKELKSMPVQNDLPNLMKILQQNLTEILGVDEQLVAGKSDNDTLGQDELARNGTKIRQSGMQDRVRDWMIDQMRKEGALLKQYSNAELHLLITGKDYSNPMTSERMEDKWAEFMTENNPLGAKHYIQGEFEYDMNIAEAVKPNFVIQRQQLMEMLKLAAEPMTQEAMLNDGARIRTGLIAKETFKTFDSLGNPERFIEQLDSRQKAAIQAEKIVMQNGGMVPQPKPIEVPQDKGQPKEVAQ